MGDMMLMHIITTLVGFLSLLVTLLYQWRVRTRERKWDLEDRAEQRSKLESIHKAINGINDTH